MLHKSVQIPFQPKPSYSYGDIGIKPIYLSNVESRKDINPTTTFLDLTLTLPIVAAPMEKVVGYDMALALHELGGLSILPRTSDLHQDLELLTTLEDNLHGEGFVGIPSIPARSPFHAKRVHENTHAVCIDVANGFHTHIQIAIEALKKDYPSIKVIAGNVASLEGYLYLTELGVDAVRVGIGGGSVCLAGNTKITTNQGYKYIRDIQINDLVLTHKNRYQKVINTTNKESNDLFQINDIVATSDHRFYVIKKVDAAKTSITEDNIEKFAQWIPACELSEEYLLVEIQ